MKEYKQDLIQKDFYEIERFILGKMDRTEEFDFREKMAEDPILHAEVELQRKLIAAVEIDSFLKEKETSKPQKNIRQLSTYGIAAALLFLLAFLSWVIFQNFNSINERLYQAYFYPDPGLPVAMSETDSYRFDDGMVSYKEEDYSKAEYIWQQLNEENPSDTLVYYLAMAKLNMGEFEESSKLLNDLIKNDTSEFYNKALWYQGLIQLKYGQIENAIMALEKLPEHDKRRNELLEKLK